MKISKTDLDGEMLYQGSSPEVTWSTNIKFTIRDPSSGAMVIMGEASPTSDYTSSGLRLRVPETAGGTASTGPKYGAWTDLAHNREYEIVVEGYF